MPSNGVCAVVITFRPRAEYLENLRRVRSQVEDLIVIDNGSAGEALTLLRDASRHLNCTLIENGENLGLGAALNIGVKWAQSNGSKWVALFDQDSAVTENFIAQMLLDFEHAASQRHIGLLVPRYIDPKSGIERKFGLARDRGPFVTITSGSFFRTEIFSECGYFQEDLFIYTIDDEYSLRLRSRGYSIAQSRDAILLHVSGHPSQVYLFGRKLFSPSNHSPGARYYLNRNRVWMLRFYGLKYPRWTCWIMIGSIKEAFMIAVGETNSWLKLRMMLLGIRDGFLMRMGNTVPL